MTRESQEKSKIENATNENGPIRERPPRRVHVHVVVFIFERSSTIDGEMMEREKKTPFEVGEISPSRVLRGTVCDRGRSSSLIVFEPRDDLGTLS